jgi:hypothetical protein
VSINIGMFYNLFVILSSFLPIFVERHIFFGILCHFFKIFLSLSFWVVQFSEHNQVKVRGAQSERTYATTFVSQVQG